MLAGAGAQAQAEAGAGAEAQAGAEAEAAATAATEPSAESGAEPAAEPAAEPDRVMRSPHISDFYTISTEDINQRTWDLDAWQDMLKDKCPELQLVPTLYRGARDMHHRSDASYGGKYLADRVHTCNAPVPCTTF